VHNLIVVYVAFIVALSLVDFCEQSIKIAHVVLSAHPGSNGRIRLPL